MPLIAHPAFLAAPTPQTPLWRYLNFPKFMSLLQRRALFFCNLEILAHSDPFEGTLPPSHFAFRNAFPLAEAPEQLRDLFRAVLSIHGGGNLEPEEAQKQFNAYNEYWARYVFANRRLYFVNCWHINEYESSAMWDIYSRREEGIAIVSSEERFLAAFSGSDFEIYGGQVRYEDYASTSFENVDETTIIDLLLKKRISFEYEKEYRLVWCDAVRGWKTIGPLPGYLQVGDLCLQAPKRFTVRREPQELEALPIAPGYNISCDIEKLVEKVYVSPLAPQWFYETVQEATNKYGLNDVPVIKSDLANQPLR